MCNEYTPARPSMKAQQISCFSDLGNEQAVPILKIQLVLEKKYMKQIQTYRHTDKKKIHETNTQLHKYTGHRHLWR